MKETFATNYSIFLEFMIHSYFDNVRVVRPELLDGKTEWFLVTFPEIRDIIIRIKTFMVRMFGDCGYDRISSAPVRHYYNTRAAAAAKKREYE